MCEKKKQLEQNSDHWWDGVLAIIWLEQRRNIVIPDLGMTVF